ncbi:MAG: hypothetical protein AABW93_00730, partial [Nanoarchaeota archaeon]
MGNAHSARASVIELREKIKIARERRDYFARYLRELLQDYLKERISREFYIETAYKSFDGKTIKEWISYYDNYIKECEALLAHHRKKRIRRHISILFFISFFVLILFSVSNLKFSPTGLFIQEKEKIYAENLIQSEATLGQSVKWTKTISGEQPGDIRTKLPSSAKNIEIKEQANFTISEQGILSRIFNNIGKITGGAIGTAEEQIELNIIGNLTGYEMRYETPAPTSKEEETKTGKTIKISSPDGLHYENVLAFTNLPESLNVKNPTSIKIHWIENNTYISPSSVQDTDNNGIYDYVSWIAPSLSSQTFEIIVITKAEHLDSNKNFISDIYDDVKELDGNWSETISENDYVRVTFEIPLTSNKDITLYPRVVSGNPKIEVYEAEGTTKIAEFTTINSNQYNKIFLKNLQGSQDTFDLRVIGGSVEFDHIIDPAGLVISVENHVISMGPSTIANFSNLGLSQNISNVVPFMTWSVLEVADIDNFNRKAINISINGTAVKINRNLGTANYVNTSISLVEFNPSFVRVQNGTFSIITGSLPIALAQSVNTSRTALIFYYENTLVNDNYDESMIRGNITNSTHLTFDCMTGLTCTQTKAGSWYVFESLNGEFTVQKPALNFITTDIAEFTTIVSVNTSRTFLIASWITSEAQDDPAEGSVDINLANSTAINGTRIGTTAATLNATVFVVTFADDQTGAEVQRGTFSYPNNVNASVLATINAVNTTISTAWSPGSGKMISASAATASESAFQRINLANSTAIRGTRNESTGFALGSWEVIEWPVTTGDTIVPKWSLNSTNGTVAGTFIEHRVNWSDDTALKSYIFSFDNGTGSFTNDSAVGMTGVTNWSNVTKGVNTTAGSTIRWIVYANDTAGNLNNTATFSYVTTNTAPTIPFVQAVSSQNPLESGYRSVLLNFSVNDTDGSGTINLSSVRARFNRTGETNRDNFSCANIGSGGNGQMFTCNVSMYYYDEIGVWTINISARDNSEAGAENSTTNFTYNLLTAMAISPTALTWPSPINLTDTNITATNNPITINNTGNSVNSTINLTAYNLRGETTTTQFIFANNFTIGNVTNGCGAGINASIMTNATSRQLNGTNFSKGNNSLLHGNETSGQEQLFFCLKGVPQDITAQSYSSSFYGSWEIRVLLVALIPGKKRKREKKKVEDDKLIKLLGLVMDELKEEYSLNKREMVRTITDKLKEKYKVSKKEILEVIKEELCIPVTIFSRKLGALESITKYM